MRRKHFLSILYIVALVLLFGYMETHCQSISPTNPAVQVGGMVIINGSGFGTGISCTVTSGPGSCSCPGGDFPCSYSAPNSLGAVDVDRGWQMVPQNSYAVAPVDTLPVDPHSSRWLARALGDTACPYPANPQCHHLNIHPQVPVFFSNPVTNSTPQQQMHFFETANSNGYQDTPFPLPSFRTLQAECGFFVQVYPFVCDKHIVTVNTQTGQDTEIYNIYPDYKSSTFTPGTTTTVGWTTNTLWSIPQGQEVSISGCTGMWAAANGVWSMNPTSQGGGSGTGVIAALNSSTFGPAPGACTLETQPPSVQALCPTCNSGGGQKFSGGSYSQLGGVDAAGMPLDALSSKNEEWYAAVIAGKPDLGHAIRTTMSNAYLSPRNVWPATLYANAFGGSGQNLLLSATATNPVVFTTQSSLATLLPCNYAYTAGCHFPINNVGLNGTWAGLNGDQTATAIDNTHFSVAVDGTSFGACTNGNGHCNSSNTYLVNDFFPYGATLRCKAPLNPASVCGPGSSLAVQACKVYINTCKKYGLIVADGTTPSDNWDSSTVSSEFHPDPLLSAALLIGGSTAIQPIENFLEVVDRSSQNLSTGLSDYQRTNVNRTYITVTGSLGSATTDILLQGTAVGAPKEKLTLACGYTYPLNAYVSGNVNPSLTYAITGIPGASITAGSLTLPDCIAKVHGMATATSTDAAAVPLYIDVTGIPFGVDGAYRLAFGNFTGDFTDPSGNTWYGAYQNNGFNNSFMAPGYWYGQQNGSWQGVGAQCASDTWTNSNPTGTQVFSRSLSANNDIVADVGLPPGNWTVTSYMEPGFGGFHAGNLCGNTAGQNVYDWQVQGTTYQSLQDGYVKAGNAPFNGYTLTPQTVTTTSGDPFVNPVQRQRADTTYGVSWSSLLIAPAGGPPPLSITSTILPPGTQGVAYSTTLTATGGVPPYTWAITVGTLPTGLSLNSSTGVISGTPTVLGLSPFTAQVTDSAATSATAPLSITINALTPGCLTLTGNVAVTGNVTLGCQ